LHNLQQKLELNVGKMFMAWRHGCQHVS